MKGNAFCNVGKGCVYACAVLLLIPLLLVACDNSLQVMLINHTDDNIGINWQGQHVKKNRMALVSVLTEENPTDRFEICRSYGCLATMTITAYDVPEEVDIFGPAGITLSERSRNVFEYIKKGPITVDLTNHEVTIPGAAAEGASASEMEESEFIFEE